MATSDIVTSSNTPAVSDPEQLGEVLEEFDILVGPHAVDDDCEVRDGTLAIVGEGEFRPIHNDQYEHVGGLSDETRMNFKTLDRFVKAIAPHLKSDLIIRTISHTKMRWPLGAEQLSITPDGRAVRRTLDDDGPDLLVEASND